jgi:hypothetical protein
VSRDRRRRRGFPERSRRANEIYGSGFEWYVEREGFWKDRRVLDGAGVSESRRTMERDRFRRRRRSNRVVSCGRGWSSYCYGFLLARCIFFYTMPALL